MLRHYSDSLNGLKNISKKEENSLDEVGLIWLQKHVLNKNEQLRCIKITKLVWYCQKQYRCKISMEEVGNKAFLRKMACLKTLEKIHTVMVTLNLTESDSGNEKHLELPHDLQPVNT